MSTNTLTGLLRTHWRAFIGVHLLFTLLGIMLLTPLFGAVLQFLVSLSGADAVADQDIARLVLSVPGALGALVMISLLLAIAALELGAVQTVAQAALGGRSVTSLAAATFSLRHAAHLLLLALHLTVRVLAYLLPCLAAVGAAAWLLLGEHDINYYLAQRPGEFQAVLAFAVLLALLLTWFLGRRLLGWCLVLPLVLFAGTRPRTAFAASERLTEGRYGECLRALLRWLLIALLLTAVPALFLRIGLAVIIGGEFHGLQQLLLLLGLVAAVWGILGFLAGAASIALFSLVIGRLYDSNPHPATGVVPGPALDLPQWRLGSASTAVLLIALTAAGLAWGLALVGDIRATDRTLVIGHRGAAGAAPENTLASVEQAIRDGADWVEVDVQESRDGQLLVVHDSDFMKLAGNPLKVWEGDAEEIRSIDVGSWFDPAFADQRVPTLEEVLRAVRDRAGLVIELKYYGHDQRLEQRVVDTVEALGMADQVVVMSLKLPGVDKLKALRPDWTGGLLAATAVGDLSRLDADFLAVNQKLATAAFIERAHRNGKRVFVWTVNDGLSMSRWMSMGVDGIITDEPALAKRIIAERAGLSSAERLLLSVATLFGKPQIARQYRDASP